MRRDERILSFARSQTPGKHPRLLAFFFLLFLSLAASALDWEAVALTPSLIQVTGDDTAAERERYAKIKVPFLQQLTGWKLDNALNDMARQAQAPRAEILRKLRAAHPNFWHEAIGQTHFPDQNGRLTDRQAADVAYYVWLPLDHSLTNGETTTLALGTGERIPFTYDAKAPSPLFKINQVGYVSWAKEKYAYLGMWLGTGGALHLPFDSKSPPSFELLEMPSERVVLAKRLRRRMNDVANRDGTPWTGEEVWEMDFSSVTNEGSYCLSVRDVGRSDTFRIAEDAADPAYRVHLGGLRHLRCGATCHKTVRRGVFPPDDGEYKPCEGRQAGFYEMNGKPLEVYHFGLIESTESLAGEEIAVPGGWHDAADYDRRPGHLAVVDSLVALARARPDLGEILDEAEWGLGHLRAAQQKDGGVGTWIETTRHPRPGEGPNSERGLKYYLSRATRVSSLEYAASAAAFAVVARDNGRTNWTGWATSARRAWDYAHDASHDKIVFFPYYGTQISYCPARTLPLDNVFMAGFNLLLLGGEWAKGCEDELRKNADGINADLAHPPWYRNTLRFLEADKYAKRVPESLEPGVSAWQNHVIAQADSLLDELDASYPYRAPWYAPTATWAHTMGWGGAHPLNRGATFVAAHVLTGMRRYRDALALCNDFHNGANPEGRTLTSGLGIRPTRRYLDLEMKYAPGITPFRWTYGVPQADRTFVHTDEEVLIWPIWRRFSNIEVFTVANSEFSAQLVGAMVVATGYLTKMRESEAGKSKEIGK